MCAYHRHPAPWRPDLPHPLPLLACLLLVPALPSFGPQVTFPSVWTNTCCSHPLAGQAPDEVDLPPAVASGQVPGIKAAAVRKLEHELGIPPEQVGAGAGAGAGPVQFPDAHWGEWGRGRGPEGQGVE